ncbi:MAG: sigma-70 family RNA polymerase sigma factor [Rhizobiaceae bacterium]
MSEQVQIDRAMSEFETAIAQLRPELHRYLARMAGSVIDGEDLVQETLLKASRAISGGIGVTNLRSWLFSIAHNTAMNFFRSQKSEQAMKHQAALQMPPLDQLPRHNSTAGNLRPLMALPPKQRSTVILRDVLGYSASDVAGLTGMSVDAVKSALHRGRAGLQAQHAGAAPASQSELSDTAREQLKRYAERFNAHDFDAVRDMLAEEVHLELVSVEERRGEAVGLYFTNYSKRDDWLMAPGVIEGRPGILAFDRNDAAGPPSYFILLEFRDGELLDIRDFRYARYVMDGAEWTRI